MLARINYTQTDVVTEQAVRKAEALFVLKLLSDHRLPQSVVDRILADTKSRFCIILSAISHSVADTLRGAGVQNDTVEAACLSSPTRRQSIHQCLC